MRKTLKLGMAATAGLLCGLAVRSLKPSGSQSGGTVPVAVTELKGISHPGTAGPDSDATLDALLAQYAAQPPGPVLPNASTARREVDQLLRMLLLSVSRASIHEGVAALNAAGEPDVYAAGLTAILSRWAAEEPEAALAGVDVIKHPGIKCQLLHEVFRHYGAGSVTGALSKASGVPAGMLRAAAMNGIASALTPDRIPETLHTLTGSQPPRGGNSDADSLERNLVRRWLKSDPRAALEFAAGQENPAWRTELLKNGLRDLRIQVELSQGPNVETNVLLKLARDPRNQDGIREELARWAGNTGGPAMEILSALPTDADRQGVIGKAISMTLAGPQSPDALAARFAAAGRMEEFEAALRSAALAGDSGSLAKAVQWTAQHSPAAWEGLVTEASRTIPFAAAKWLTTLPLSPERDRAVAIFARIHAASDPERSAAWAESITDPGQRGAALSAVSLSAGNRDSSGDSNRNPNGGTAAVRP